MIPLGVLLKVILVEVFFLKQGICEDIAIPKLEYMCGISDSMKNCKDYNNEKVKGDRMLLAPVGDDGEQSMSLTGYLEITAPIDEGYKFNIEVSKHTEIGDEDMWTCTMDVCKSLQDKNAPWTAAMEAMGITECPVKPQEYKCANLTLDFSCMKDKMQEEFIGEYNAKVQILDDKMNPVSCHELELEIKPVNKRK